MSSSFIWTINSPRTVRLYIIAFCTKRLSTRLIELDIISWLKRIPKKATLKSDAHPYVFPKYRSSSQLSVFATSSLRSYSSSLSSDDNGSGILSSSQMSSPLSPSLTLPSLCVSSPKGALKSSKTSSSTAIPFWSPLFSPSVSPPSPALFSCSSVASIGSLTLSLLLPHYEEPEVIPSS